MSTLADYIVAHRELDADPVTRALRAALTPLNEQNHLPVVHATLGEIWAAEAEMKAVRFVIGAKVRDAAASLIAKPDDADVVFDLAYNWVVPNGWFEFGDGSGGHFGLHFHSQSAVDCYGKSSEKGTKFLHCGRWILTNSWLFAATEICMRVASDEAQVVFVSHQFLRNFCCIMAFLACPGATVIRRSFHAEKLQRSRRKRTGFGFCSHNIVEFPRAIASKSTSDTIAVLTGMMRRHLVRGHLTWRDTPRERWQPAYWRGNAARGVIVKDYYCNELAG